MNNDFFNVDLTRTLPPVLKNDPKMQALSQVIAKELQENARQIKNNVIFARIDELPEKLLDVLAYDLHIDWYEYNYPLQVKRDLIKTSVRVHKKMGTIYAVETAIRAIYPESRVEEWFNYGGKPFCFKVILNAGNKNIKIDMADMERKISTYKRLTAHLDSINIEKTKRGGIYIASSKEIFIKSHIGINPYYKAVQINSELNLSIRKFSFIKVCYCKG